MVVQSNTVQEKKIVKKIHYICIISIYALIAELSCEHALLDNKVSIV